MSERVGLFVEVHDVMLLDSIAGQVREFGVSPMRQLPTVKAIAGAVEQRRADEVTQQIAALTGVAAVGQGAGSYLDTDH